MEELLDLGVLTLLGHVAIFHVLGGGALGVGARQWRNARLSGGRRTIPFLMFWGILFGGIPLALGAVTQEWALLAGQGGILLASFAITFFFIEPVRDFLGRQHAFMIGFGVLFMVAGGITTWLMLRGDTQTVSQALTYGSVLFFLGTLALAAGLAQWVRGPKLGRKEKPSPEPPPEPVVIEPEAPIELVPAGPTFVTNTPVAPEPNAEPEPQSLGEEITDDMLGPVDIGDMLSPVDEPTPPEGQS